MRILVMLLLCGAITGCNRTTKKSVNSDITLEYTFLEKDNHTNPRIRGIWKSIGNGYFIEIREDSLLLYSYTESYCYKEKNHYLEGLLNSQSQFALKNDTIGIYLTDYGERTKDLQAKKDFVRVDKLPSNCMTYYDMTQLDIQSQFHMYQETLEENYAFTKERQLNWTEIFNQYQDSLSSEENALFKSIGKIATLTKDHHTKVINKNGKTRQYRVVPSASLVVDAFKKQSEYSDLNDYFNLYFKTNYKNITDSLLLGNGEKVLNGKLEWGSLDTKIGYIHIHSFAGFSVTGLPRKQQIDSINHHMDRIINSLSDKEAIIVDISFNFGGYDASGITVASYFTNQPVLAYYHEVYNDGKFYQEDSVIIKPLGKMSFTKPVYVLMTDISRSAAESFAMMMGALPNAKLAGTRTLGIQSGMLGKSIGEFYTTMSNQRLLDTQGKYYEVIGVQPDIELEVFKSDDVLNNHKNAIRVLMDIIINK